MLHLTLDMLWTRYTAIALIDFIKPICLYVHSGASDTTDNWVKMLFAKTTGRLECRLERFLLISPRPQCCIKTSLVSRRLFCSRDNWSCRRPFWFFEKNVVFNIELLLGSKYVYIQWEIHTSGIKFPIQGQVVSDYGARICCSKRTFNFLKDVLSIYCVEVFRQSSDKNCSKEKWIEQNARDCANFFSSKKRYPSPLPFFNIPRPIWSKYEGAIER